MPTRLNVIPDTSDSFVSSLVRFRQPFHAARVEITLTGSATVKTPTDRVSAYKNPDAAFKWADHTNKVLTAATKRKIIFVTRAIKALEAEVARVKKVQEEIDGIVARHRVASITKSRLGE